MERVKNASQLPKVYYGLHMSEGLAEYRPAGEEPFRILINENVLKKMDRTFAGRPVYVRHVEDVNIARIQEEADGYVIESFFNKMDGKHWSKFIAVSDRAHDAIQKGWTLSNAYKPSDDYGMGGTWHGMEYDREVTGGEYEHLAIVPDPRYQESRILTPEEFKAYNSKKEQELVLLANSQDKGNPTMLQLFKRTKLENSKELDLESTMVVLPKSKKEMSLVNLVNEMDKIVNMAGYCNGEHMVKVGDEEMTVNDLVSKHLEMKKSAMENEDQADADAHADHEEEASEEVAMENEEDDAEKEEKGVKNSGDDEEEEPAPKKVAKKKIANARDTKDAIAAFKAAKKRLGREQFDKLMNAEDDAADAEDRPTIDLSVNQLTRGQSRYGSGA